MKKKYAFHGIALSLSLAFVACQGNKPAGTDAGTQQQDNAEAAPGGQQLIADPGLLPGIINYEGEFRQAARWPGEGTTFYAVVSKYEQGEFFTPTWVSRLNIYLFELAGQQLVSRRAFRAEAPNIYSKASLKAEKSKVVGLPSTGPAFSIVYAICPDGEDPCSIYSNVIGAGGKYDFQVMENVEKAVYLEARGAMMAGIPEDVQQHMIEQLFE
ncbi:MAG: hypothetical protein J5I98_30115 [Phaeodactylibacter sp.]|nr:hypothetical protein [Phaeodactylibacter sp.]